MYKLLIFLKKTDDLELINHFENITSNLISDLIGKKVIPGKVESNLLLEEKYCRFLELAVNSKDELDKIFNTKEGKALNNDLMAIQSNISIININFKY